MDAAMLLPKPGWLLRDLEDVREVIAAAQAGEADAMRLCSLFAASGVTGEIDWGTALAWSQAAAERGDDAAQTELILLSADEDYRRHLAQLVREGRSFPLQTWAQLAAGVDLASLLTPPPQTVVFYDPLVVQAKTMASPGLCAWLMAAAKPELERATVAKVGRSDFEYDDARTNSMVGFPLARSGLPLVALRQRIAATIEMPVSHFETTNLLHYAPGEQFTRHYDSLSSREATASSALGNYGQRRMTVLIYLNDEYDAGYTSFDRLNWQFRGQVGEALFWRNTTPTGEVHLNTLHAGLPPTSGSKWVLSQWVRERPVEMLGHY
ncbi:MAG: hypothetical protein JWM33_1574 [Caulobacteraceae bacterium]|nr:hypothetical protein [Caulobacteraceae bacterium]